MSGSPGATATGPAQAPGAGGVRVVEEGFTQRPPWPAETGITVGAMVQNTSDLVAYGTTATFRLLDAKGTDIGSPDDGLWRVVRIPVIMPGDRVPVGTGLRVDVRLGFYRDSVPRVASVEIRLKVAQWWAPENSVVRFSAVRANNVVLDPPPTEVSFSAVSPYCDPLAVRGGAVVYRDRTGRILGGSIDPAMEIDPVVESRLLCPAGTSWKWQLRGVMSWLAGAASVEAAAYCDFVARDGTLVPNAPGVFKPASPSSPQSIN